MSLLWASAFALHHMSNLVLLSVIRKFHLIHSPSHLFLAGLLLMSWFTF